MLAPYILSFNDFLHSGHLPVIGEKLQIVDQGVQRSAVVCDVDDESERVFVVVEGADNNRSSFD